MTASRCQSWSSSGAGVSSMAASDAAFTGSERSTADFLAGGFRGALEREHVAHSRLELDEVSAPAPEVALVRNGVVHLVRVMGGHAQCLYVQVEPARLDIAGIEIDHGDHDVRKIGRGLAIGNELIVVGGKEGEAPVALQRRIVTARRIHAGNE